MLLQLEVWTLNLTPRCTWEIGAFLEAESKMLAATAEVNNPQSLKVHKSGLELWRLLKYNFWPCISVQRDGHPRECPQHADTKEHARCIV